MRNIKYVGQVMAGAYAYGVSDHSENRASVTTYEPLEALLVNYGKVIEDGAWVVDAREIARLDPDAVIEESFSGPMVDVLRSEDEPDMGALTYVTPRTAAGRWLDVGASVGRWSASTNSVEPCERPRMADAVSELSACGDEEDPLDDDQLAILVRSLVTKHDLNKGEAARLARIAQHPIGYVNVFVK